MGVTNLEIYTGGIQKVRAQASPPTSPAPETGDVYLDTTNGGETFGIYSIHTWKFFPVTKVQ